MKRIFLATLSMTLLTAPAFSETVIAVSCQCSFNFESGKQSILVYGERTDATVFDVENCVLEDGKVAPGTCWSAKGEALMNCAKEVHKLFFPEQKRLPEVTIEEDACYGQVGN